jgi:hypothetical protein
MDPVRLKLREAKAHLATLSQSENMKGFYPTLNAFWRPRVTRRLLAHLLDQLRA